ncbi:LuxR C-terminal-related transcriptional regulator [Thermodesulfobacteriota bacterium]
MTNFDSKIFTEFSEVLNVANYTLDRDELGREILDILFRCFDVEKGGFGFTDENSELPVMIAKNIDEKWVGEYQRHFHKYSPFRHLYGKPDKRRVFELEEVVDRRTFFASEFYNDFFKPQKILYKIFVKLEAKGKSIGEVCFCRSPSSRNFSSREIAFMGRMSDYVSYAMEHNKLLRKINFNDNLLKIIENQWDKGIIILDDNMKLIFINQKGKEFCRNVIGNPTIPPVLLEGFHSIMRDLKQRVSDYLVLPRYSVLNYNSKKLSVYTQIIDKDISLESTRSFMITIEELNRSTGIDKKRLKAHFRLTEREIDIVMHVFEGLKNSEIAQDLYVSEVTVKKHIQNIFEKVDVKNRTALINRVLNQDSHSLH